MKRFYFLTAGLLLSAMMSAQTTTTFTVTSTIETFTVPACVTSMTIEARGAQGSFNTSSVIQPGMGAIMIGTFAVTPGQVLKIAVGQQYSSTAGNGGGGGSFVTDNSNNPLIVAGGGGGSSESTDSPDKHGQVGTSGGTGAAGGGLGGVGGTGGYIGSSGFQSGAGGGLLTNGADGWTAGSGGQAFVNGAAGANVGFGIGGFGGGGNGSGYVVGGGGGGYSGGGGGGNSTGGVGGGGGSYNSGTSQTNAGGVNAGNGTVIFTYTVGAAMPTSVTGVSLVCEGTEITLTAATVPGAISYNWSVPASATITSGQGTNIITMNVGTASGIVSVTVTDPCGTSAPATFSYTVNLNPVITASPSASPICAGSSATLSATGATSYSWSSGGTDSTEVVSPATATSYTVIGTDSIGCADTATVVIDVNALPVVNLGADTAQCGGSVTLDAQNFGSTYLWSDNSTTQLNTVSATGAYDVAVMDVNGCVGRDTINVTINAIPVVVASAAMTTVCIDDASVALFGSPSGGSWTGTATSGSSFFPDTAGIGTHVLVYSYTDSLGCSGMDSVSIDVQLCTNVDDRTESNFGVYPNPNNGTFTVAVSAAVTDLVIEITDVQGRVVYSSSDANVQNGFTKQISLENEASGMYLLRVVADGVMSVQKVSVQK